MGRGAFPLRVSLHGISLESTEGIHTPDLGLTSTDRTQAMESRNWQDLAIELRRRGIACTTPTSTKRMINHIQTLPRTLNTLVNRFIEGI